MRRNILIEVISCVDLLYFIRLILGMLYSIKKLNISNMTIIILYIANLARRGSETIFNLCSRKRSFKLILKNMQIQ